MSREVIIQCPQCKSGYHKIIKFAGNSIIYQCSCGKKFKAEFDKVCIACDILEDISV